MADEYRLRAATIDDLDALVAHRVGMFTDMGTILDAREVARAFRDWLADAVPSGLYRAWVVEAGRGAIVAGGGLAVLPWPPGPLDCRGRIAFVYNVYTEPGHRRRGLARRIMDAVHAWCRDEGVLTIGLAASASGRPLYESMGYRAPANPYLFISLDRLA